jgi:hypothetical protein
MTFLVDKENYTKQGELALSTPRYSTVEHRIMRNGIQSYTLNTFAIPYPIAYKYFSYYKLLYWSGYHVIESIEAGLIVRDDIAFKVQYNKEQGLTRGEIIRAPDMQYCLSFRSPDKQWHIDPVVIISQASPSSPSPSS